MRQCNIYSAAYRCADASCCDNSRHVIDDETQRAPTLLLFTVHRRGSSQIRKVHRRQNAGAHGTALLAHAFETVSLVRSQCRLKIGSSRRSVDKTQKIKMIAPNSLFLESVTANATEFLLAFLFFPSCWEGPAKVTRPRVAVRSV